MLSVEDIVGISVVLAGGILFLWRNKRKFERTNAAGIEQFASYGGKVASLLWDSILWLSAFVSVTGGVLFLANVHESTWGWIVLLPCYALLLFGLPLGRSK